jgi:hypothetical protein
MALEHGAGTSHTKRVVGETATAADADLATLGPGLFLAQLLLAECLGQHVHLFTTNALSIFRALD